MIPADDLKKIVSAYFIASLCYTFFLQASRTVMDSNRSTAEFDIPNLSAEQEGLWECRVSTDGGQDSREFTLTVKGV